MIQDGHFNIVVEKEQDAPIGIPFYETSIGESDLIIGEFMISNIFIYLPKNTREQYPEFHTISRSIILWYYALEQYSGRPILMQNYKLSIVFDDNLDEGFIIHNGQPVSLLKIAQNVLGKNDAKVVEKHLLETVLGDADKKGFVLDLTYLSIIDKVFSDCQGGMIVKVSEQDLIGNSYPGKRHYYIVDNRMKGIIMRELSEKFNVFPIGALSVIDSANLINKMIHYLNNRITTILEQYDIDKLLSSLMTIRDGVIFWHNTMSERYNSIIKLYNFVGSKDPVQEQKIHELTECDLCARCLVEYVVIRCKKHGKKDILMDVDAANELFALMTILIGFGYLSDYYKSDTFDKVIEVLPDGLFSYPIYKDIGINKYAKIITLDKIENPEVYNKLSLLIKEPDYNYEHIYEDVFADEFGINYEDFRLITETIIGQMQADEKGELIEEIGSFKDRISGLAKIDNKVITAYINAGGAN